MRSNRVLKWGYMKRTKLVVSATERNKSKRRGIKNVYVGVESEIRLGHWSPHHSDMWVTPDAEGANQAGARGGISRTGEMGSEHPPAGSTSEGELTQRQWGLEQRRDTIEHILLCSLGQN